MGERAGWEAEGVSGEGVSRNRERKAHVEGITVWVRTQPFFTVRFVKESR